VSPYREAGARPHESTAFLWEELARRGPMGLTHYDMRALQEHLPPMGRAIFKYFVESLERQSTWIVERTAAMRDEAERIALIGQTMKRAGLRSYTDKDGAIFVAGDP